MTDIFIKMLKCSSSLIFKAFVFGQVLFYFSYISTRIANLKFNRNFVVEMFIKMIEVFFKLDF